MKRKLLWTGFILCLVLVSGGLFSLVPVMAPVQPCNSAEFWKAALGVELPGAQSLDWFSGAYPPRDGHFICYIDSLHGKFFFKVKEDVALADFPEVVPLLDAEVQRRGESAYLSQGYRAWLAEDRSRSDAHLLLRKIREASHSYWRENSADMYRSTIEHEDSFERRWKSVGRYWVNVVFEFVYLNGLVVFLFWPWLRRQTLLRKCIHLGLLPFLLILPYHLGYGDFSFESVSLGGGVLYPWLVFFPSGIFWGWPWLFIDPALPHAYGMFVHGFPKPLLHISQPFGPMMTIIGGPAMDLVGSIITGAVLGFILFSIGAYRQYRRMTGQASAEEDAGKAGSTANKESAPCFWPGYRRNTLKFSVIFLVVVLAACATALLGSFTNGAFQRAAYAGQIKTLRFALLLRPSLARATGPRGFSALHAAAHGYYEDAAIKLLLDRGADPNAQAPDGRTPLHLAAAAGRTTIAELLVAGGADVNAMDHYGETPLHQAHSEKVVALLIKHGAEVNILTPDGRTPLHFAAGHYSFESASGEMLLENGADLEPLDNWGQTPLHLAARNQEPDAVRFLLSKGANPNARREDGKTPLHMAAQTWDKAVKALLEGGADINALTPEGLTPLDLVRKRRHDREIKETLLAHGAKSGKVLQEP